MTTPIQDPSFAPACFVFGFSLPGHARFGNTRWYPQQAIFGTRPFGWEIPGKNTESDVFAFRYGAQVPRAKGPWPVTPLMGIRAQGVWAKRIIFYTRRGFQVVRRLTPAMSAAKDWLVPTQLKFEEAARIWMTLSAEAKARAKADAKSTRLACRGNVYFTKLFIKDDPRWRNYV